MIMYNKASSSFYCSLLVSFHLLFYSNLLMRSLKIGSLNINGGRDQHKRALISEVTAQKRVDVLFLQETHTVSQDEVDWGLWWEGSCYLSHGTNVSAGVAILLKGTANATILSSTEVVKGRLLMVRAEIESSVFCFVNVYAPNWDDDKFFAKVMSSIPDLNSQQLIFGGDFFQ